MRRLQCSNKTPHAVVVVVGSLTCLPAAYLAARGAGGVGIYGCMGSLATYGFITIYGLIAVAMPIALHRKKQLRPAHLLIRVFLV